LEKDDLKNLFTFNKAERRGAFALSIAIFIVLIYNIISPTLFQDEYDFSSFNKEMAAIKKSKSEIVANNFSDDSVYHTVVKKKKKPLLYNFNPNTTTEKEWVSFGLTPKQAKSICKYTQKGGRFYSKDDLKKMYCLNSEQCNRLMPFVVIDDMDNEILEVESDFGNLEEDDTVKIDLNTANFESLMNINGIGPSTAKGILKYKDYLGGYVDKNQLLEVYHIDSSRFKQIAGYFIINTDSVKQFNINTATYYDLKKHPYISKNTAYEITQYRSIHGNFKAIEELKKINSISDSLYHKIYLYFAIIGK
jgi:DNA uptake protein ComE-like DNA-binding protein